MAAYAAMQGPAQAAAPMPPLPPPRPNDLQKGWEGYKYIDDSGREVYGTRYVGNDHENGYSWANPDSGFQWKGLLG
ncbi:hypothetical protein JNW90_13690 [Micromonospora sp. STR1s_5]|nr:hypothetical protein [Micromonospora sp. STR1s_5]